MIVRTWRGKAAKDRSQAYEHHFDRNVLPGLGKVKGFLGAMLLRRETEDGTELLVVTRWESLDAVKAFAGEDYERAVVEPEAAAALVSFDATVTHYETVREAHPPKSPCNSS